MEIVQNYNSITGKGLPLISIDNVLLFSLHITFLVGWLYWCLMPLEQLRSYHGSL